jgi:hypothetical protein
MFEWYCISWDDYLKQSETYKGKQQLIWGQVWQVTWEVSQKSHLRYDSKNGISSVNLTVGKPRLIMEREGSFILQNWTHRFEVIMPERWNNSSRKLYDRICITYLEVREVRMLHGTEWDDNNELRI